MRLGSAGPGRQVQDGSYYFGRLNLKIKEILKEAQRLDKTIEHQQRQQKDARKYQQQFEAVMAEVREYEGKLADYNLAYDKARGNHDPAEIELYLESLKERNYRSTEEQNDLFLRVTDLEGKIKGVDRAVIEQQKVSSESGVRARGNRVESSSSRVD